MSVKKLLTGLIAILSYSVNAQVGSIFEHLEKKASSEGKVKIVQSSELKEHVEYYQWQQSKEKGIWGYRIKIFSDSGPGARKKGEMIKARFSNRHENVKVYYTFQEPFYNIYVGDFRTESEALKFLKEMDWTYAKDAYYIYTRINYPNLQVNE